MEFGNTLKAAREAKGFTTSQIAEQTHIMVQIVEDLENDRFSRIAAPIYGRGFIKLYCGAVGLDPKPLIDEYMAITNGEREVVIRRTDEAPAKPAAPEAVTSEAPTAPVPEPAPLPEPEPPQAPRDSAPPAARTPFPPPELDLGLEPMQRFAAPPVRQAARPAPAPEPARPAETAEPTAVRAVPPPSPAPDAPKTGSFSRYASPLYENDGPDAKGRGFKVSIPPTVWRLSAVVAGLLAVVCLLFLGGRALYRLTMAAPDRDGATAGRKAQAPTPAARAPDPAKPSAPRARTPGKPAPFYMD